ncbi:hypothetical protein ACQEVS_06470 [Streptomyces sp. CA-181903]|uniref:hypothetical protein n=1 Tax=Streptomyces sp. CA-181903 TaxID=3240055 RepID=UPI003D8DAF9E
MTRATPERPVDVEAIFPELTEHRRASTRLHPRQGDPQCRESSVAGPFLWPAEEPWPVCTAVHVKGRGHRLADVRLRRRILREAWQRDPHAGPSEAEREVLAGLQPGLHAPELRDADPIPLLAGAQLFAHEVPGLVGPEGCDLLQVLWCPFEAHGPDRRMDVLVKWRRSQGITEVVAENPEPVVVGRAECVPNSCVLHPEQVVEHEYMELLGEDLQERIRAWEEEILDEAEDDRQDADPYEIDYQGDLSIPPGWKVGGFASWHLTGPARIDCSCGAEMSPLLTVHDREWDSGSLSWVPLEDRQVMRVMDANTPTGVYVGRGLMRIFACTADPGHPPRIDFQ